MFPAQPLSCAVHGLRRIGPVIGEDILLTGAGTMGLLLQLLNQAGARSVSVVDRNVDQHGTRQVAEEYLKYLYSKQGQEIAAKHFYRPRDAAVAAQYAAQFANIPQLVTIDAVFGGWTRAQATHFADHGTFDRIYGQ